MKDLIRKILKEYKEEEKILVIPSLKYFGNDWNALQLFLKSKGNPKWKILDGLNLYGKPIKSLGNLISVGGDLDLDNTSIKSLGNLQSVGGNLYLRYTPIESLGNLISVGGNLNLYNTPIESFGNLISVGGYLYLSNTPLSKKYTEEEIRQMVNVKGNFYM
jgi:hypothetical protein